MDRLKIITNVTIACHTIFEISYLRTPSHTSVRPPTAQQSQHLDAAMVYAMGRALLAILPCLAAALETATTAAKPNLVVILTE